MDGDPTEHYYNSDFASWAEWFAARYRLKGAKALKATLAELTADSRCYRELFWGPASELMAMGLSKAGIIVRDASLQCVSLIDTGDYFTEDNVQRRIARYRRKAEPLLAQAGLSLEWLEAESS